MTDLDGAVARPAGKSWPVRFGFLGLCFLAVFICYIDRVNISVAILAMQETYGWSDTTKGFVLSSFFFGYTLFLIPGGWLANRFGGKVVMGLAVLSWSIITILTPSAAALGLPVLFAARIAMGLAEAATFPALYSLFGRWAPPEERTRFVSLLISGVPAGTLFALLTTGWFVTQFGWPSVFHVFGAAGLVFMAVWFAFVRNDPLQHPMIGAAERSLFDAYTPQNAERPKMPWGKLFRLRAFWALLINHFCLNWTFFVLLSWMPTYFRESFGTSIANAGLLSAAPWLIMFVTIHASGHVSDGLIRRGMSVTHVRKLVYITGLLIAAGFLLTTPFVQSKGIALAVMCIATCGTGISIAGFGVNHLDIAPRHAGILMGITNTAGTLPGVIGVGVTGWLVDQTGSFDVPLALSAGLALFGALIWLFFASGERLVD